MILTRARPMALAVLSLILAGNLEAQTGASRGTVDPTAGYTAEQTRFFHQLFDLGNWQVTTDEDYARYTLLRTAEFFPEALLRRSGPITRLPEAPRSEVGGVVAETPALGKLTLDSFLARSETDGFIVVHHGRIVYERYPRMRRSDTHLLWSISKTFAGLLVAQLAAERRVAVQSPIEQYVPELASTAWQGTRVIDILDMASGMDALENDEANTWERPELAVFQYESSLGLLKWTPAAARSTREIVASIKRRRPSGEAFEYMSVDTFVLAWLVESVTRKPYAAVLSERIWSRMGAEADGLIVTSPRTGATAAHGGISATLRDIARYGLLFTRSRPLGAADVVPAGYLDTILRGGRPQLVERAGPGSKAIATDGVEAAHHNIYQWDAVWPDGDFFKAGFRGQGLYVSPSRDLVIAYVSSDGEFQKRYARVLAHSGLF